MSGDRVLARACGLAGWLPRERVNINGHPAESKESSIPIIVRTYTGTNQEAAARAFQIEAADFAQRGYYPKSQSWAQGSYGCGSFLLALLLCIVVIGIVVFIYMLFVKPEGTLTVTYEYRAPQLALVPDADGHVTTSRSRPTKRCPRCAEDVLVEALICRYCGHDFTPPDPAGIAERSQ